MKRFFGMMPSTEIEIEKCYKDEDGYEFRVNFNPTDAIYRYDLGGNIIFAKDISDINWCDSWYDDDEETIAKLNQRKQRELDYLLIRRQYDRNIHYAV